MRSRHSWRCLGVHDRCISIIVIDNRRWWTKNPNKRKKKRKAQQLEEERRKGKKKEELKEEHAEGGRGDISTEYKLQYHSKKLKHLPQVRIL